MTLPAVFNRARFGAARVGYFGAPSLLFSVNGVNKLSKLRRKTLVISDSTSETARTCHFSSSEAFAVGSYLKFSLFNANNVLFLGAVRQCEETYVGVDNNLVWNIECVDLTCRLNRRKVWANYTETAADLVVKGLIATFAPGFTTNNVAPGLDLVTVSFSGDDVTVALSSLATLIGGYFYLDYQNDVHFFVTEPWSAPQALDSSNTTLLNDPPLSVSTDLSQIRTRVNVRGASTTVLSDVAAGETILPITTAEIFDDAGGTIAINGQKNIPYTGLLYGLTGTVVGPGVAPTNALLAAQDYYGLAYSYFYCYTFVTAAGESLPGPDGYVMTTSDPIDASHTAALSLIMPGPSGTTARNIYRSDNGALAKLALTIADNTTTTATDNIPNASLGSNVPITDTSGLTQLPGQAVIGATTIPVAGTAPFSAGGGWVICSQQYIRYSGIYGNTLTGVPASGPGAITASLNYGADIITAPTLTGVSGLAYSMVKGDSVWVFVQCDDLTAQAALGALELDENGDPTDGIHEHEIADTSLRNAAECAAAGAADLYLFKNPLVTLTYDTRDQNTRSGRIVHGDLASHGLTAGDFMIQSVQISEIDEYKNASGAVPPRYHVIASNTKYTLADVLRHVVLE